MAVMAGIRDFYRAIQNGNAMDLDTQAFIGLTWSDVRLLPWHWIVFVAHVILAVMAAVHAMLYKRDSRSALGWISVSLLFPFLGPFFYYVFGINRIQTQARKLVGAPFFNLHVGYERGSRGGMRATIPQESNLPFHTFAHVSDQVTTRPLTAGNTVEMLQNGDKAYPAMLAAINAASHRIYLMTYLFEADAIGEAFVAALTAAQQRGVDVRVIVDGVGELYSRPRVSRALQRSGVRVARFLPPKLFPPSFTVNLRNHRKVLVVDGEIGFTGGMNIGARQLVEAAPSRAMVDLHFCVRGAVIAQLEAIFVQDWRFTTGEDLEDFSVPHDSSGSAYCRCISDGPDDDLDKISLVLMGAISAAQREIFIVTPYFLPSREMIASLQSAALRGVHVTVILPQKSNLRFVDWATRNLLWELLQHRVTVCYQPAPFAHTKLFVVDGIYAQVGSANMDPRSLRLNFELNLEIFGQESVAQLLDYVRQRHAESTELRLQEIVGRGLGTRLRDAACWLFLPYL